MVKSKRLTVLGGTTNIVFVTSTTHTGNLGGLAGADSVCQIRAASAGLTGTYRAWLSTTTSSPAGRFPQSTSPYSLVNGTVIANNWTDLTDGSLLAPIDRNELGDTVATTQVWTGTASNGTYTGLGTCNSWAGTTGFQSNVGDKDSTTSAWTLAGTASCTSSARLYCFLQVEPPDTTPPNTTITSGPSGTVTSSTATFNFSSSEPGSTFECSLDGSAFTACSSGVEYTGLANGNHYFQVRATDAAGNTDGSAASRTFTVRAGAGAVTFIVDRLDDSAAADECIDAIPNDCSLRRAIGTSADGDIITFDPSLYTAPGLAPEGAPLGVIELVDGEIDVTTDITITGPGPSLLTIDGNAFERIFNVSGATLQLSGVTLTGGAGLNGGAIYVGPGATLSVDQVRFFENSASNGGGIYGDGAITVTNSLFHANVANAGGGINHQGSLSVTNSTFSGNTSGEGGAIYSFGSAAAVIRNTTITLNSAVTGGGGGLLCIESATVSIGSSIISDNFAQDQPEIRSDCDSPSVVSAGYNQVGDDPGDSTDVLLGVSYEPTDIRDVNPLLGPLQDNGGPTWTHGFNLSLGLSPTIDQGNSFGAVADQRGMNRTVDFPSIANPQFGDGTDIGAFEMMAPTAAPVSIAGRVMTSYGAGIRGAVVTVQDMNGGMRMFVTNAFGHYRIDGLAAGETYFVSVSARRYAFANGTQLVNLEDNVDGLDFTASP